MGIFPDNLMNIKNYILFSRNIGIGVNRNMDIISHTSTIDHSVSRSGLNQYSLDIFVHKIFIYR